MGTWRRAGDGRDCTHADLRPVLPDRAGLGDPRRALDPIILRNLLLGCRTFNEIAAGAPGLSRALLARRLRELERAGVVDIRAKPSGRGSVYEPTPAGRDLAGVLESIGG